MLDDNSLYSLSGWTIVEVKGTDSERFLNGQLTSDVSLMRDHFFSLTCRVNRTAQLQSYFFGVKKNSTLYFLLVPNIFVDNLIEDLNKYIIMDDVELTKLNLSICLTKNLVAKDSFLGDFFGEVISLSFGETGLAFPEDYLKKLKFFYGVPEQFEDKMINEFALVDTALSRTKGCYIGQETVNKIENNRGAGKKEILIKLIDFDEPSDLNQFIVNDKNFEVKGTCKSGNCLYFKIDAPRELRINGKKLNISMEGNNFPGEVVLLPLEGNNLEKKAKSFFEEGAELFINNKDEEAKLFFELSYRINPRDSELIESLGVLEGRLGNYEKAIEYMNKLEEVDPSSVMPFTNRSLFYMKMGEIEKAEEQKSLATVKSFGGSSNAGDGFDEKKKRLSMYEQVLEIDEDDVMANIGSSYIYFELGEIEKAETRIDRVLAQNENDIKALALKSKILVGQGKGIEAQETLEKTIDLASKKGDFLLANEMQSLNNSLRTS